MFSYARAGHEVPLLLGVGGDVRPPGRDRGQPLGLFAAPDLDEQTVALAPGGALLLYTDGAADLTNAAGVPFGPARLLAAAQASRGRPAQAICDQVWRALTEYQGAGAQDDDVALVAIRAQ